jgi:hypothetical protein
MSDKVINLNVQHLAQKVSHKSVSKVLQPLAQIIREDPILEKGLKKMTLLRYGVNNMAKSETNLRVKILENSRQMAKVKQRMDLT